MVKLYNCQIQHTCVKLTAKWPRDFDSFPWEKSVVVHGRDRNQRTRGPVQYVNTPVPSQKLRYALTLNNDVPGLDSDLDPLGDLEQFLGMAVKNLSALVLQPEVSQVLRSSPVLAASSGGRG